MSWAVVLSLLENTDNVSSHPDKVKLAANQTMEEVSSYFVELTKAYKSFVTIHYRFPAAP